MQIRRHLTRSSVVNGDLLPRKTPDILWSGDSNSKGGLFLFRQCYGGLLQTRRRLQDLFHTAFAPKTVSNAEDSFLRNFYLRPWFYRAEICHTRKNMCLPTLAEIPKPAPHISPNFSESSAQPVEMINKTRSLDP